MKSICRAAVAQWTKRLTRNEQTRVQIWKAHIFNITCSYTSDFYTTPNMIVLEPRVSWDEEREQSRANLSEARAGKSDSEAKN